MNALSLKRTPAALVGVLLLAGAQTAHANYLTYGNTLRTAGLGSATDIHYGPGNATAAVVNSTIPTGNPADPWVELGSVEGGSSGPGTIVNGKLTVTVSSGSWGGGGPITGTWTINDSSFWSTYGYAAISMHVGNGGGDPDHWIWELTQGATSGTWNYQRLSGGGGGLSNLKLYGHGSPQNIPVTDGGSTLAVLGMAFLGLGGLKRHWSNRH